MILLTLLFFPFQNAKLDESKDTTSTSLYEMEHDLLSQDSKKLETFEKTKINTNLMNNDFKETHTSMITKATFNNFTYQISKNQVTITKYNGPGGQVIIPEIIENCSVVSIGKQAFMDKTDITNIILPETIISIMDEAFKNCFNLTEIILPNKIELISTRFLFKCSKINTITIPKSLNKINGYPFANSSITKVIFEEGITNIIGSIFFDAFDINEIILPQTLLSIGDHAFRSCLSLKQIDIPENVTSIGQYAFSKTNLTSITLPNKITIISNNLFGGCNQLSKINLPQNITRINNEAFYNCIKLEQIELPNSITSIGSLAFYNCKSLTELILPNKLEYIGNEFLALCINIHDITIPKSIKGRLTSGACFPFEKSSVSKLTFEVGTTRISTSFLSGKNTEIKDVALPSSLLSIENNAFEGCSKLTKIDIPENVTNIGNYAFMACGLTSIIIPSKITTLNNGIFKGCNNITTIELSNNTTIIGSEAFYNCFNLEYLELPSSIFSIGNSAFYNCQALTEIILPNKLNEISSDLCKNCSHLKRISIPLNVTKINDNAFYNCTDLENIELPNLVTHIGNLVFYNCLKLKSLILPCNINYIGYQFISKCSNITEITIPKSLKSIFSRLPLYYPFANSSITKVIIEEGTTKIINYLFHDAEQLKDIILPSSIFSIGDYSFHYCSSLTKISIPENVTSIGQFAFASTNLTSIVIPNKIKIIYNNLFGGCIHLSKIILPQNITKINDEAFYNCQKLENIELPNSITSIGSFAFHNCKSLTELILPNKLEYIGSNFISNCINIHNITIPKSLKFIESKLSYFPFTYSYVDKIIIEEGTTQIIDSFFRGKPSEIKDVVLPSSLLSISNYAFESCSKLTTITIPESVTSIGKYAFSSSGLTSIIIPNKITILNNSLFRNCNQLEKIILPPNITKINDQVFYDCRKLVNIELPEQVKSIGNSVFYNCVNLENIKLSDQITSIGNLSFYYCQKLTELILPKKIEYIGYQFIAQCIRIKNISIPKTLKGYYKYSSYYPFLDSSVTKVTFEEGTTKIVGFFMAYCKKLNEVILPSSLLKIGEYAFEHCSLLTQINIPPNVLNIDQFAFASTSLSSIILPNKINIISNNIFGACNQLKSVTLPKQVTVISSEAFYNCISLEKIELSNNITFIGSYAFFQCYKLKEIILPNKLDRISNNLFYRCIGLTTVVLPQNIATINHYAFYECISLKEINCPNKLTSIGSNSFRACTSLARFLIHPDVVTIESSAFSNCPSLTLYVVAGSYAEEYAKINNINFSYYLSSVTLNTKIINNSDISGMKLILKDSISSIENSICLNPSTNEYLFYGLLTDHIYTLTLINKYGNYITHKNSIRLIDNYTTIELIVDNICSIDVSILDKHYNNITSQTTIRWYDINGNYLQQASNISQIINGTVLFFDVELDDKLSLEYYSIHKKCITVSKGNDIMIYLQQMEKVNLSGILIDDKRVPVSNANILVSQILNEKYPLNIMVQSDTNGSFSIMIYNTSCKLTISKNGFIDRIIELNVINDSTDIGSISLAKITGKPIHVDINYIKSVTDEEEKSFNQLYFNSNDLKLNLYDYITNKEINDFLFQNNKLILTNSSYLEVPLLINVSINSIEFDPVTAYLEPNTSNISITLIQRGKLMIMYEKNENSNSIVMIYDKKGKLVNKFDFTLNNATSTFLENGEYTIIAMGKSSFFNNIQTLTNLVSSKLVENIDYVSKIVNVTRGKIQLVNFDNVPQFDESKFYYTNNEKTIFITNKASAVEGSYFSFKCHLEFKNEYRNNVSNIKIIIEIPENCEYLPGSLIIDKKLASFTINDNKIIIPIDVNADILRFCLIPTTKGNYIVNAYVEFDLNGETIFQPIESAQFEAIEMDFFVPDKIGMKRISSFGIAPLKSRIFLYCDDILVGETASDNKGQWMIEFDLINPSTYSKHLIYMKIELSDGLYMTSKSKKLIYSRNYIDVYQIIFYVNGQKVSINYQKSNKNIYYSVPAGTNQITFIVNFTNNNPEIIKDVKLIITQLDNKIIKIPTFFNEDEKLWMATHNFPSSSSPIGVEVSYECDEEVTIPNEILYKPLNLSEENVNTFEDKLDLLDYNPELVENTFSNEKGFGKIIHKINMDDDDNITKDAYTEISIFPITDEDIEKIKQDANYMKSTDENGNEIYIKLPNGLKLEYSLINVKNKTINTFSISEPFSEDFDFDSDDEVNELTLLTVKKSVKKMKKMAKWIGKKYEKIEKKVLKYINKLCKKHLGKLCAPKNLKFLNELIDIADDLIGVYEAANDLREAYDTADKYTWRLADPDAACIPPEIIDKLQRKIYYYYGLSVLNVLSVLLDVNFIADKALEYVTDKVINSHLKSFDRLYDDYKCRPQIPEYPNSNLMCVAVFNPIIDPSGYVYEAVESNRVKDVTTTIFEKITKVDIYGDEYEVSEIWDAEQYGQKNPLTTDNLGWYAWDVPKGMWQVRYEKINYETLYSEWLPVPPPQLDVNVPLISYTQPEVKRISGYENRVEIEFTKYMKLDKLDLNNIILTKDNNTIKGEMLHANKEVDPTNKNLSYASLLHFKPDVSLHKDDLVNIFISKNISSYSGVTMNEDYNESIVIKIEPKIIVDSDESNITYGEIKVMKYSVDITPFESINGKKLILQSDSPNIVELESDSIEINNNGKIVIPTKILLPGIAHVEMMLEKTGIKAIKTINIDLPKPQLNPVVLSVNTDTCVNGNTAVNLYSNIEGSIIYYSTKSSLNLDDFILYHGSIIITENTLLSAYAHNDNYRDSEITSYYIKVCKNNNILITFNANEGITDISTKNVKMNEKIGYLPTPIKEFYTFDGWYMEPSFENIISNETIVSFSQNIILYAKWTPNTYVITFETNGGSHVDNIKQPHGTAISEPKSSTKEGYEFIGWYEEIDLLNKYVFNLMPTKNITLYAKWTEINDLMESSNKKFIIIGCIVGCAILIAIIIIVVTIKTKRMKINNFSTNENQESSNQFSPVTKQQVSL